MTPDSRIGWTFSESMVQVKKPFEKFVTGCLIIGFSVNVLVAGLLYFGVLKRPGSEVSKTPLVPAPTSWNVPYPTASENKNLPGESHG